MNFHAFISSALLSNFHFTYFSIPPVAIVVSRQACHVLRKADGRCLNFFHNIKTCVTFIYYQDYKLNINSIIKWTV